MSSFKILLVFLISFNCFSQSKEKKLLKLVRAEIESIAKVKKRADSLSYRLFELYTERVKLKQRIANYKIVKGLETKKNAFKETMKFYKQTQDFGYYFTKKYTKSRYLSNIYFTLASNIIEIRNNLEKDEKEISELLKLSIVNTYEDDLKHRSRTKLAELYYTLNKFEEAVKYYEIVIKNKKDPWLTKNLLNLSWSYFQVKNYPRAINLVLRSNRLSRLKSKKYTDVSDQISKAINYFYTFNKEPEVAIDFHFKYYNDEGLESNIIKLLNLSLTHISSKSALNVEKKARGYCKRLNKNACLYLMSKFKLDIYKDGKDYEGHYLAVRNLRSEYKALSKKEVSEYEDTTNEAINNIAELSSYIQSLAYKDHYIIQDSREPTYSRLIFNYDSLKVINPKFKYEYSFLQAEISYKEKRYDAASSFYLSSHKEVPKKTKKSFYPKLFKSMLALANEKNYSNKIFFEKTYLAYLVFLPSDSSSPKIYDSLFKFYMQEKNRKKATKLIHSYHKFMPVKVNDQREMLKVVLNKIIQGKESKQLASWIKKLETGYLKFNVDFIKKNIEILAGILFEKARELEKLGDTKKAVAEYKKIYKNKQYPQKIKNDSAFNVSIIYLSDNKVKSSFSWMKKVLDHHIPSNIKSKLNVVLTTAQQYYLLQSPKKSQYVYDFIAGKYCKETKSYASHYVQHQELNLVTESYDSFNKTLSFAKNCKVKKDLIEISKASYIEALINNKEFRYIAQNIKNNINYKKNMDQVLNDQISSFWASDFKHGQLAANESFKNLKNFSNGNKYLSGRSMKKFANIQKFVNFYQDIVNKDLSLTNYEKFDLKKFTAMFQAKMGEIANIKNASQGFINKYGNDDPNIYTATLAITYFKFEELLSNVRAYKFNVVDKQLKKDLEKNFTQIQSGLITQKNELQRNYKVADSNNTVRSRFSKYFNFDKEMSELSLYQNKKVNPLDTAKSKVLPLNNSRRGEG